MNIKLICSKKRTKYYIAKSQHLLNQILNKMPDKTENYKLISPEKGFSAINLILYVLQSEIINNLYISSLCIGKKEAGILAANGISGKIKKAFMCVSIIMKSNKKYKYWEYLEKVAENNGWIIKSIRNHSKIILMETNKNNYVVETSANLNKNPQVEFYNIENDIEVYNFYKNFFEEVME